MLRVKRGLVEIGSPEIGKIAEELDEHVQSEENLVKR